VHVDGYSQEEKNARFSYALKSNIFILCCVESAGRVQWPDFASPDVLAKDIDAIKMRHVRKNLTPALSQSRENFFFAATLHSISMQILN
jgi:hypothetical protein